MHALRVHCGSYLYDSICQQWLTEEERQAMERRQVAGPLPTSSNGDAEVQENSGPDDTEQLGQKIGAAVQWPLFGSPTLSTIRVTSYTDRGGVIYFTVQPTLEGFRWAVERTFEEFSRLHKTVRLVDHYGISKTLLPTRRLFGGYFGSSKPQYLSDLQMKLDQMLKTVLQKYPIPPRTLLEFCGYPFCDVLSITQALAVYIYDEGDYVLANNKALFMSPVQLHCIGQRMTLPIASSGTGTVRGDFGNLLDFLMQLQKLKVAPSTEDKFTLSTMQDVSFDLSIFKSLTYLMVDSIEIGDLQGRQAVTGQLEGLDIRRCLNSLKEILVVYPVDDALSPLPAGSLDLSRALKWTSLTKICFKLNNITSIDTSLQLLPALTSLDLTYNYIEKIENLTELPNLKVVDLSYNKVSDVRDLHLSIGNVSKLGLAHNLLTSLEGFDRCFSLVYLDLSSNQIAEVIGVSHLSGLPVMEELFLQGNPLQHSSSSYRSTVLSYLPSVAEKLLLDGKMASPDELELSASLSGIKGHHRRVPSRTADIKPDRFSPTTQQEAQEELEVSTSVTSRLEEMRKTGGDKWLSLLNTGTRAPGSPVIDGDNVVTQKKKKKRHHKHHGPTSSKPENDGLAAVEQQAEPPAPAVRGNQQPLEVQEQEEEETSPELRNLIQKLESEKLHMMEFPVTVLEYGGPLDSLSATDVDQKLVNSRLEECSVCVDTTVRRLVETVLSTSRTRCQRDLALMEDIRFHEGKKKGVCLRFSQFSGAPLWVIYCVRDLGSLARLYVAIQQALKNKQSSKSAAADVLTPPEVNVLEAVNVSSVTHDPSVSAASHSNKTEPLQPVPQLSTNTSETAEGGAWKVEFMAASDTSDHGHSTSSGITSPDGAPSSGHVSPLKIRSRSRSPSPKAQISTKKLVSGGGGGSNPNLAMRPTGSGGGAALEVKTEEKESTSAPVSLAPSPTTARKKPPVDADSRTRETDSRNVSSSPRTERKTQKEPAAVGSESNLQRTGRTNPTSLPLTLDALNDPKKPAKLTTGSRKIIKKPGLERDSLVSFFGGKIAREQKEVLMNVLWGGASLTSAPGCEIESGVFVSNKGVYLLQVTDGEGDEHISWYSENPPLICSFHAYHLTLSQVKTGIFDQSITLKCIEKGALKSLVVFPRTSESTLTLLDNLKAALDSMRIPYLVTTVRDSVLDSDQKDTDSSVLFVNPDVSDLQKLKENLVSPVIVTQLCSHKMAGYYETSGGPSFAEETKRGCENAAAKFEVLQYVVVSELSSDLLPITNGVVHFRPHVLVLTNEILYLCTDEAAAWPADPDSPITPPFPRCCVLDSCSIRNVTEIEMCERAQSLVSISDPVYEFRVSFNVGSRAEFGPRAFRKWQLCVYDRQYIDQFFSCLQPLWYDIHHADLPVSHTAHPLVSVPLTPITPTKGRRSRSFSEKPDITTYDAAFYRSQALVRLASLSSSDRVQFFKERVSEAQFMNSDEVPLAVFLAVCSVSGKQDRVEIEVCVMASQYAIYLVSDVDNIRRWMDGGGPASFSRMSLLSKQNSKEARCFFHLWIKEIREINMGFFYLSLRLKTTEKKNDFCVHSQDATSMLAFLSAISSSANLRNTVEEKIMDELLSEYIDLGGESLSKGKQVQKGSKTNIEFREVSPESMETLKQILLCISPSITKSTTIDQSTSGLQILLSLVVIMVEEISIAGARSVQYHPQLVLLSNYGLFVCANSAGENTTPAVLEASDLRVKRWCHIDLIEHVQLVSSDPRLKQCKSHVFSISLQSQRGSESRSLVLATQNYQQLRQFLYHLSLLWHERNEKNLPIYTV